MELPTGQIESSTSHQVFLLFVRQVRHLTVHSSRKVYRTTNSPYVLPSLDLAIDAIPYCGLEEHRR